MKIYKLNSLTTLLFGFLVVGLVFFLPIFLIETLWNNTVGRTYTDVTIDIWQALILWLVALVLLNIAGLFKFEFAVEATDTYDKDTLKKKVETLKKQIDDSLEKEDKNKDLNK